MQYKESEKHNPDPGNLPYLWQSDGLPRLGPGRVPEGGELAGVARGEVELEGLDDEVLALGLRLEQRLPVHFLQNHHWA